MVRHPIQYGTAFFVAFSLCLLLTSHILGQTTNQLAKSYFEVGIVEKDLSKKIAILQRAVEADPNFVQALFYLGMAYKTQGDLPKAAEYLKRAREAATPQLRTFDWFAILYELARLSIRLDREDEAETLLKEASKLKLSDQYLAKAYFEWGRMLFNQGRYTDALEVLTSGSQLQSAQKQFFINLITLCEKNIKFDQLYAQAEIEIQRGNVREAKNLLEQIKMENPKFRDVETKIAQVDSIIREQMTAETLAELYAQAVKYEEAEQYALAIATFEGIQQKSANYKDVAQRIEAAREKFKLQQQELLLSKHYEEGIAAYNSRDWTRAIAALEQVVALNSSYRDARQRLAQARRQVAPDTLESAILRYYRFGLEAMENDDFEQALQAFRRVERLKPNYRNVGSLIAVLERATATGTAGDAPAMSPGPETAPFFTETVLDSLYHQALEFIDREEWLQAIVHLEKLRLAKPGYRDVDALLGQVRLQISDVKMLAEAEHNESISALTSPFFIGGGIVAMVLLPLIGFIILSPMARAKYYLLRGNYTAAALIYENALARNPGKLKLYPRLAHVYILSGRNDDQAIKVFRTVLKLNLETEDRTEMNQMVTNYLKAGEVKNEKEDAISVLESALREEMKRRSSES